MTCPACGIENPPSANCCGCGYGFVSGSKPKESAPAQPQGTWCPKCKALNPASNQFCGKCGAATQKKTSPALIGCLGLIGVVVLIGVFRSGGGDKNTSPSSSSPSSSGVPAGSTPQTKPEPRSQWGYSTDDDTMGRKRSFAHVMSNNSLSFDFPYEGSQHGTLVIRKSPQWGTNVMVCIERGQFLCGIDQCIVNVRFDGGPIQRFSASEPSDHSTTTLFLRNEGRFVSQLRRAKVVRIEATFYQEGSQALEFNVEGFDWQWYLGAPGK
jgi:hypothetical protein